MPSVRCRWPPNSFRGEPSEPAASIAHHLRCVTPPWRWPCCWRHPAPARPTCPAPATSSRATVISARPERAAWSSTRPAASWRSTGKVSTSGPGGKSLSGSLMPVRLRSTGSSAPTPRTSWASSTPTAGSSWSTPTACCSVPAPVSTSAGWSRRPWIWRSRISTRASTASRVKAAPPRWSTRAASSPMAARWRCSAAGSPTMAWSSPTGVRSPWRPAMR